MLGGQAAFFLIEAFHSGGGETESLPDGNLLVLVFVAGDVVQGFHEMFDENRFIAFLAAARGGDHNPIPAGERLNRCAAGAGAVDDYNAAGGNGGEQVVVLSGSQIGAAEVELVAGFRIETSV